MRSSVLILLLLAGCSVQKAETGSNTPYKKLNLKYPKPVVGADVQVSAEGLPAGKTAELQWGTVTGGWVVEDYYHFKGKKYTETTKSLGKTNIDSNGRLNAHFLIP